MIEPMYRVEHHGFYNDSNGSGRGGRGYIPDGAVYENYSGAYIASFSKAAHAVQAVNFYFKEGGLVDIEVQQNLSCLCREIWKRYWITLSRRQKIARILFAHRAWIAALITSVLASSITLAVSNAMIAG